MTFKDPQLNSMTFQAWKMKFLNSITFQVFHDLQNWALPGFLFFMCITWMERGMYKNMTSLSLRKQQLKVSQETLVSFNGKDWVFIRKSDWSMTIYCWKYLYMTVYTAEISTVLALLHCTILSSIHTKHKLIKNRKFPTS